MAYINKAYSAGDMVYVDNTLCKVIAPTASGATYASCHTQTFTRSDALPMMTLAEYTALPAGQRPTFCEITDTYPNVYEVKFGEPDFKPIRYRSICMCCGAPVNDYGKCEYCGTAHQYAD